MAQTQKEIETAIETWKNSERGYLPNDKNAEVVKAFMENPQQFGYYIEGRQLCYARNGDTPSKRFELAQAEFETAKKKFRPGHPKYQQAETKAREAEQRTEASFASLEYSVRNLSQAFIALMADGYLDRDADLNFNWPRRNIDPTRTVDNDVSRNRMPTKKAEKMSAPEFIRNVESSEKFREAVNGPNVETTLTDKQIQDRAVLGWLAGLNSAAYTEWLSNPENRELAESLAV
jgi:hypothetical protein